MKVGKVRGIYKACEERNRQVVKLITRLKSEHPYWGYRRIWANLRHYYGINISQNTIYKLMQKHDLLSKKYTKNKALRVIKSKPQADRHDQGFNTDGLGLYYGRVGLVQQKSCWLSYWITKQILRLAECFGNGNKPTVSGRSKRKRIEFGE